MECNDIRFAKEICFNAILPSGIIGANTKKLYEYEVTKDDVFVRFKDTYIRIQISRDIESVIYYLNFYKNKCLLRLDKLQENKCTFTILAFTSSEHFDEKNELHIIVDQALAPDLRKNNIEQKNAVSEIKKEILVDGKYSFSYGRGKEKKSIELIGVNWSFVLEMAPQKYLHVTAMRKRNNKSNIENAVVLLSGKIVIEDNLNDRSVMTQKVNEQYNRLIKDNSEFIKLWDIYDTLEMETIKEEAKEMGYLHYKSYKYSGQNIIFNLVGYTEEKFLKENMYYAAISEQMFNAKSPLDYNIRSAVIIGSEYDKSCVNTPAFVIKEDTDTSRTIPKSGFLLPSLSGSVIQRKRRNVARLRILKEECQLPGLKNILQAGSIVGVTGRKRKPVSEKLEKSIFNDNSLHFTEKQKQAIDVAINTPDIAIIQGPPGTGKTTVIRAILYRIDEIENSNAKVLISATQHDAVDNAVSDILYGGVPVNRVAVRRKTEENNSPIYQWIDDMIASCEDWLKKNQDDEQRSVVRDVFSRLVSIEESSDWKEKLIDLTKIYEQIQAFVTNTELMSALTKLLAEINGKVAEEYVEENSENELYSLIQKQRTVREAFLDDGIIQLKLLEKYLKYECEEIDFDIPEYWRKLKCITEYTPELDNYLDLFKKDLEMISSRCVGNIPVDDKLLEMDLKHVICGIRTELLAIGENKKQSITNILWEFKQELTNSSNVKKLIESYSKVNAATCQQAANKFISPSMKGFDDSYDYVIVDEAARSNPLDLLIPMSMGKKVILVGDHKQLPHMVERDIIEKVKKKTGNDEIGEVLEESLFMRLNKLISIEDSKNGIERTCMLTEQYRMHPDICNLVNIFYDNSLQTSCSREKKEQGLGLYNNKALAWIDMPMSKVNAGDNDGISKSRNCEVTRIEIELSKILAAMTEHDKKYNIGIITFYGEQAGLLRKMIEEKFPSDKEKISVGTVDAFQGKEFDIVLLSTVRSNNYEDMHKRVGFLDNDNRLCVAFSRAKRLLITVGDSKTVACDKNKIYIKALAKLYEKCKGGIGYYE